MKIWRRFFFGVIFVLAATQSGCGGGGGGIPPPPPAKTYAISGTISAAAYTAMDSDVNDSSAPYKSNDDFAHAQTVGNPVAIGGYVNQPRAGVPGRSQMRGDVSDFYKVTLAANQIITLSIGESNPAVNDLDVYLYSQSGTLVDSTEDVTRVESIKVVVPGTYYVEVFAYTGAASTYTLTIGFNSA